MVHRLIEPQLPTGFGRKILSMRSSSQLPNTTAKWVVFNLRNSVTLRKDGSETSDAATTGWIGPMTYRTRATISFFNVPWRDVGPVEQWHYGDWSKQLLQQRQGCTTA